MLSLMQAGEGIQFTLCMARHKTQEVGFYALVKEMTTHSSTLAWKIPWMKEPGRLQSMGFYEVEYDP